MANPSPEARSIADNLVQAMQFFGTARDTGDVLHSGGMTLISSGINYAAFNAAILARPFDAETPNLDTQLRIPARHFAARNLRWTYWFCEDYLPRQQQGKGEPFGRFGLRPLTEAPGMYAEKLKEPKRTAPSMEIRRVGDQITRDAFTNIIATCFDIPMHICSAIYAQPGAWNRNFIGWVAYHGQVPVSVAATATGGDAIGLYSIATLPSERKKGYAEAVVRHALAEAQATTGIERTVLQSTEAGLSLYKRLGYREVTRFRVYIS